jgi:16S rRNA C1402 N4-methylase RsmH
MASDSLHASLRTASAWAEDGQDAWRILKKNFEDERNDLERRKAGRVKGTLTGISKILMNCKYRGLIFLCLYISLRLFVFSAFGPSQILYPRHSIILSYI